MTSRPRGRGRSRESVQAGEREVWLRAQEAQARADRAAARRQQQQQPAEPEYVTIDDDDEEDPTNPIGAAAPDTPNDAPATTPPELPAPRKRPASASPPNDPVARPGPSTSPTTRTTTAPTPATASATTSSPARSASAHVRAFCSNWRQPVVATNPALRLRPPLATVPTPRPVGICNPTYELQRPPQPPQQPLPSQNALPDSQTDD